MHILNLDPKSIVGIYESPDLDPEMILMGFYSALDPSAEYFCSLNFSNY
jgi:hypothetical protein